MNRIAIAAIVLAVPLIAANSVMAQEWGAIKGRVDAFYTGAMAQGIVGCGLAIATVSTINLISRTHNQLELVPQDR